MTTLPGVISYPIPIYQNLPIEAIYYKPNQFFISAVSLGITTTVTTTANHNYVIGQQCRMNIPPTFGCRQLNGLSGIVLSVPSSTQVQLSIDSSRNVDPFVLSTAPTQAQILAIGDFNSGQINNNGITNQKIFIPGSFQNISPL